MATIENNKQYRTRHIIHVLWITFIAIMFGMVFFFTLIYKPNDKISTNRYITNSISNISYPI